MEIQKISDRHRCIMVDKVLKGMTGVELCEKYDISQTHLSVLVNSPLWKKESAIMHDNHMNDFKGKLLNMVPKALKNVHEIMERETSYDVIDENTGQSRQVQVSNPPATRLKASELVLNATGLAGKDKYEESKKSVVINLVQPKWESDSAKTIDIEVN